MQDVAAVQMEIQAFLTDGGGGKDKRPERRVERLAHDALASLLGIALVADVLDDVFTERQGEMRRMLFRLGLDEDAFARALRAVGARRALRQRPYRFQLSYRIVDGFSLDGVPQQIEVLVEHGLEMRIARIDQYACGIPRLAPCAHSPPRSA